MEILNLSHNALFGSIPSTFDQLVSLTSIDLSNNQLEGPIPNTKPFREAPKEAFRNNKGLCRNAIGLKDCPSPNHYVKRGNKIMKLILFLFLGTIFLAFVAVGFTSILCRRKKRTENKPQEAQNQNLFTIWSYDGKMV